VRKRLCTRTEPVPRPVAESECDGVSAETRDCVCVTNFYAPSKGGLLPNLGVVVFDLFLLLL